MIPNTTPIPNGRSGRFYRAVTSCSTRGLLVALLTASTLTVVAHANPAPLNTAQPNSAQSDAATRQYAAAVGFQNQKLYADAIDEWKTFLRKFPNDKRRDFAQHYLGTCCLQEKRYTDAASAFAAVSGSGDFKLLDQSLLNLGIAQYGYAQTTGASRDYTRAELSFRRMLTKFPRRRLWSWDGNGA